jgi:hypothetical protein
MLFKIYLINILSYLIPPAVARFKKVKKEKIGGNNCNASLFYFNN